MYKYCFLFIVILVFIPLNLAAKNNIFTLSNINLTEEEKLVLTKIPSTETKKDSVKKIKNKTEKLKFPNINDLKDKELKLEVSGNVVTYKIYNNGRIVKFIPKNIAQDLKNKIQYVYFDKEGKRHFLGIFTVTKTPMYKGEKGEFVNLINAEEVPKYYKEGKYQYQFNFDSPRTYLNEQTLAGFFGALFEVNFLDISCNGFSHKDGSSKPSRSHINGNNGDFKYLRMDQSLMKGPGSSLNIRKAPDDLDFERQNLWNDALFKFGWKSMLGWSYKIKGKTQYLNHITHRTSGHHHHLHIQDFEPNFKEIKE